MGIFDAFTTTDQDKAAADQKASLAAANEQGQSFLANGLNAATDSYTRGIAPFLSNLATDQAGQGAYADATGANGGAGTDRAIAAFRASPGYAYAVDQGSQNVMRNAAATGQLASGGTNVDLLKVGQGLADQDWQKYIANLLPFLGQSTSNAGGVLAGNAGLAGIQNANQTTAANMAYGTNVGIGNANASADLAGLNASGNILNFGMNAAKAAAAFI